MIAHKITMILNDAEAALVDQKASARNMTDSDYVRGLALSAARRDPGPEEQDRP